MSGGGGLLMEGGGKNVAAGLGRGQAGRHASEHGRPDRPLPRRVVAALPAASHDLLRSRFPRVEVVALEAHRPGEPAAACLVDPGFLEDTAPGGHWVASIPQGLPVVVWADLSPRGMRGVLAAAPLRPIRLLIEGVDDVASALEAMLGNMPRLAHVSRLHEALRAHFERVPLPIRAACARAIDRPESFFDAADLARAARMSRRHVDRILMNCGFAPAKTIVVGARIWLAHLGIATERRSVPEAARKLGYADPKALLRHIRVVSGEGARGFRQLAPAACLERVVGHMARRG